MTKHIDVATLRDWLDEGQPVTVVDVRSADARAEWSIPGSIHVDAYAELRQGRPGSLATASLPADRPIVTVCNAGKMSEIAADALTGRGLDARSLVGGMKAWSLAWNGARAFLIGSRAQVIQLRRTGKGCLSYLVTSGNEAVVIDPSLSPDTYVEFAHRSHARITHVLETHIHADHLSRARQLAAITGAALHLPAQQRVSFAFSALSGGDRIAVGDAELAVLNTPGHTMESVSFVLDEAAVFTGDTLFINGVGRPDLHADADAARHRARLLYRSLQSIRHLNPDAVVLPTHTNKPVAFDSRPVAATIAEVACWLDEWLSSESDFVDRLVSRLPDTPPNFATIVELNERGDLPSGDVTDLEAGANRCAVS
jgi:glyoxylase-like metal-dependent hydrolase (beta-lactamase superfamily II)/rhodanese-related sulfurtransferase